MSAPKTDEFADILHELLQLNERLSSIPTDNSGAYLAVYCGLSRAQLQHIINFTSTMANLGKCALIHKLATQHEGN